MLNHSKRRCFALDYIEHKYIKKNSIEKRDYQVNLANQAISENCLIVLPTGLGKTAVALQVIANYLTKETGGVLFPIPSSGYPLSQPEQEPIVTTNQFSHGSDLDGLEPRK